MLYQFPFFAWAHVIASVLALVLAAVVYTRRANAGYLQFSGILLILSYWSAITFMEVGVLSVEGKRFWSQLQYLAIVSLGPVWLLFAAHLTRKMKLISSPWRHLIWLIPMITLFAAFTDARWGLLWGSITIPDGSIYPIAVYGRGPVFFLYLPYTYALLLIGTVWLVKTFVNYPPNRKKQLTVILILLAVGLAANIIHMLALSPIPGLDLTSLSFTFIAVVLFWFISRNQLFDLVPIARSQVIDNLSHGVIVMNEEDVIVDINPAAVRVSGYRGPSPIGMPIWDAFSAYSDLLLALRKQSNLQVELELPTTPPRLVEVNITYIHSDGQSSLQSGQIITIHDITQRKSLERVQADQRRLAEALADSASAINSTLQPDEVLERILENVGKVVPHDAANISMVDENGVVRFVRTIGYERFGTKDELLQLELNLDSVPNLRQMAQSGQPCIILDTQSDPNWVRNIHGDQWIRSYLGAPIIRRGILLGFINLDATSSNFFKPEQVERLRAFADQAAIAIENAQLFSQTTRRAEEMRILYEVGLAVTSGLGMEKTIHTLYDQLKKVIPINLFYLALVNRNENTAAFTAFDEEGKLLRIPDLPLYDQPSLTRYTIEKQGTVYIPDVHAVEAEFPYELIVKAGEYDENSHLGIPLIQSGRVLGVLAMRTKTRDAYSAEQIRLVETIASQASIAVENARMYEEMQHLAVTDSLTGIYNRRFFFPYADTEIERSRRYRKPLSVILMDVDHFKTVNDRFGHQAGDHALKLVVDTCLAELRKVDVMCRFGGEEFIMLLPETPKAKAEKAALRIRDGVEAARLMVDGGEVAMTVSMGVTELCESHADINALIKSADQALYQAKAAGRNQVIVL